MTGRPRTLLGSLREARRAVRRHRVLLAGGLAAGSVAAGLSVLAPAPAPSREVLAAAHDLVAGAVVTEADLVLIALPLDLVPSGALTDPASAIGRLAAGPVRRGEPITDVRVVGSALLERADAGTVATPVRLADPAAATLLRVGDRVDVLVASSGGSAVVVAPDVEVLAVPAAVADSGEGALVVVAATPAVAARLAAAAVAGRLSVTVRR